MASGHGVRGELEGRYSSDGAVASFWGVPYAAPPVGELRWRPPVDAVPRAGVRPSVTPGPIAP